MKQRDRVIIAILFPVAIALVIVAIVFYNDYAREMRERDDSERFATETEKKKLEQQDKVTDKRNSGGTTPKPEEAAGATFEVVPTTAARKMGAEKRREVFDAILAVLKNTPRGSQSFDKYFDSSDPDSIKNNWQSDFPQAEDANNAYFSLLNFRENAPAELLRWLATEPQVRYYALKACVALKSEYAIDSDDPANRFIDAALAVLPQADVAEQRQIALLLGCYREDNARVVLRAMLADEDTAVRHNAIAALGRVGEKSDALLLAALLDGEDAAGRTAVCDALDALLNYNAGTDLLLPSNYTDALDQRVALWQKWLAENHDSLAG